LKSSNKTCKYCHKELKEVECPKEENILSNLPLPEIILIPIILFSWIFSKKENKKIITCNNKDCINYLNGCF